MSPIDVSEAEGEMVQNALEDRHHGSVLTVAGVTVKVSEIKAVKFLPKADADDSAAKEHNDWWKEYTAAKKLSPHMKVARVRKGFSRLFYKAINEDEPVWLETRLLEYFEAHPERTVPDMSLMSDSYKLLQGKTLNHLEEAGIRIVAQSIALDVKYERKPLTIETPEDTITP